MEEIRDDNEKLKMSREEVEQATDKILFPEGNKCCKFMGMSINIRPLSIYYAKKVNNIMLPIQKKCMDSVKDSQSSIKNKTKDLSDIVDSSKVEGIDLEFADSMIKVSEILLEFYDCKKSFDEIDRNSNLDELLVFINLQLQVNGENDFLLKSLSAIMHALNMMPKVDQLLSQLKKV